MHITDMVMHIVENLHRVILQTLRQCLNLRRDHLGNGCGWLT